MYNYYKYYALGNVVNDFIESQYKAKPGEMIHGKIKWSTGISLGFTINL